jgi:hypothetical protein
VLYIRLRTVFDRWMCIFVQKDFFTDLDTEVRVSLNAVQPAMSGVRRIGDAI